MSHIYPDIDFAASVFAVHVNKVLFIKHKQLSIGRPWAGTWIE